MVALEELERVGLDAVYRRTDQPDERVGLVLDTRRLYVAREANVIAESFDPGVAFWEDGYHFTPTQGAGGVLVVFGSIREAAWMREHPLFGLWAHAVTNDSPVSLSVLAQLLFGFDDLKETNPEVVPVTYLAPATKEQREAWKRERARYVTTFDYLDYPLSGSAPVASPGRSQT